LCVCLRSRASAFDHGVPVSRCLSVSVCISVLCATLHLFDVAFHFVSLYPFNPLTLMRSLAPFTHYTHRQVRMKAMQNFRDKSRSWTSGMWFCQLLSVCICVSGCMSWNVNSTKRKTHTIKYAFSHEYIHTYISNMRTFIKIYMRTHIHVHTYIYA